MTGAVLVLHAAYVALLASTFTRTLTWLRSMLVLAAIAFILFGLAEDIPSMVGWNVAIGSMHLFRIGRDFRTQRSVQLSSQESDLRDEFFPGLSDFDFNMLWCMGASAEFSNELMIAEGSLPEMTSLVLRGAVAIEQHGEVHRGVRRGGLVGEMSFVSGLPANVNVFARGEVSVHQWEHRQLASLDRVHPTSARAFRQLLSQDLVAKARV